MDIRFGTHDGKPTVEEAVKEKIKVLKEFKVVSERNIDEVRQKLFDAVRAYPNRDYEIVLEQITQSMIMDSMKDAWET